MKAETVIRYIDGKDRVTQARILEGEIKKFKNEAHRLGVEWDLAENADKDPSHLGMEGKTVYNAYRKYHVAIEQLNILEEAYAKVTGNPLRLTFEKKWEVPKRLQPKSGTKKYVNKSSSRERGLSSTSSLRKQMLFSPVRGRGVSCSQPRDPRTGKFVSRYY